MHGVVQRRVARAGCSTPPDSWSGLAAGQLRSTVVLGGRWFGHSVAYWHCHWHWHWRVLQLQPPSCAVRARADSESRRHAVTGVGCGINAIMCAAARLTASWLRVILARAAWCTHVCAACAPRDA